MATPDPNDRYWYTRDSKVNLGAWIFTQMALGACYAALAFFAVLAFIFALIAIGNILPEDPFAALDAARGLTALV